MESSPLEAYFALNEDNHQRLIVDLLAETNELGPTSAKHVKDARRHYFEVAIAKGMDPTALAPSIAALNATQLMEEADKLPDVEAKGLLCGLSLGDGHIKDRRAQRPSKTPQALLKPSQPERPDQGRALQEFAAIQR
jgi:hypothetical protein